MPYLLPSQMKIIPTITSTRSRAFAFRFRSLKIKAPKANDMMTDPLRTRDTTEIIESGLQRALK